MNAAEKFGSRDIRNLRNPIKLTQNTFANVTGVFIKTVETWERGTDTPMGSAGRMLAMFQKDIETPQK